MDDNFAIGTYRAPASISIRCATYTNVIRIDDMCPISHPDGSQRFCRRIVVTWNHKSLVAKLTNLCALSGHRRPYQRAVSDLARQY
jgi:hypothetical protein